MGQELGIDCQSRVFPLSDRLAEMEGILVDDHGGEQVEPGHEVVLALAAVREGDTLVVPKLVRLARFVPDARGKEKLHGKQPKLSVAQQRELCRMHAMGEYSISNLAEVFSVSGATVYRTLNQCLSPWRTILPPTGIDPSFGQPIP